MHYVHLGIMTGLMFFAMYAFMYAMVDRFENVFPNINQAYMAGLMTAPMLIIELLVMGMMYPNKTLNAAIIGGSVVLLGLCWFAIRGQTAVGNVQFIKSMIPHHSGAILMCGKADLTDAKLKALCGRIIKSQREEIDEMKAILAEVQSKS
jgi:uncharacterized protein (DUF305 family)